MLFGVHNPSFLSKQHPFPLPPLPPNIPPKSPRTPPLPLPPAPPSNPPAMLDKSGSPCAETIGINVKKLLTSFLKLSFILI